MALKYSIVILILCTLSVIIFVTMIEQNFNIGNRNSERVRLYPARFPNSRLMDLQDFKYIIGATCNASLLAWIVTSYSGDPTTRSALRRAYPNDELQKLGIHRIFLLGMLSSEASHKTHVTQDSIFDESLKFKDIVQGNFQEAYRNLTYKHLMGLRWAVNTCNHANYIMKMDDDIVVNLYDILNILQTHGTTENTLMGYVLNNMLPIREPANKWFVTREEFAPNVYPEFLSGWLYITSSKIAEKLVSYAQVYPKYFWIDDLFITGILRNDLKIEFQNIRNFYATDYRYLKCCIKGMQKRLKCEFAIGPNGGKAELQVEFKDFAKFCQTNCSSRIKEFSVNNTCIVAHEEPNWVKGRALIEPVRIL